VNAPRIDVGPCCACGGTRDVRNVLMLHLKAPVPRTGWGCFVCGLANDGALAVICDDCLSHAREATEAALGFLTDRRRIPVSELRGHHDHDLSKHKR
jgi:hypothetical protein